MLHKSFVIYLLFVSAFFFACGKEENPLSDMPKPLNFNGLKVDGRSNTSFVYYNVQELPQVEFSFSTKVDPATLNQGFVFISETGTDVDFDASLGNNGKIVKIKPSQVLNSISHYTLSTTQFLKTEDKIGLKSEIDVHLITAIDSIDKFPRIGDDELLDLVQKQTFAYFWNFAHPVSGLARERNTSGDLVTSGGSGFGIMAIIVGIHRGFISRAQGLQRLQKIVTFLKDDAETFHGAFSHWLNGATGKAIPFSDRDNGADLVETSFLMQGLLAARQFFDGSGTEEMTLRQNINELWQAVEWSWFTKNGEDVLYWHWSPDYGWEMNHPIRGWNECLITYVLAASSPNFSIPKSVYDKGWANNGEMKNGASYFGIPLPLGPNRGGPLFFSHYSFLGINPHGLTDAYANYWEQNQAHALINYEYCLANPQNYFGYSSACWGLTASDDINGYLAHSPTNDNSVVSPTAALSSFPYTPEKSMKALEFYYYKMGDKLWKEYGFVDAFSLHETWFVDSFLAIDQGPIIVMIENHRSGLLWDLFMSCPEVKTGMTKLGFQSPNW